MNKEQENELKEERYRLETEIEQAEAVWDTKKLGENEENEETIPGLSDKQKEAILKKIERVDFIDEWLLSGVKPSQLRGRLFSDEEVLALVKGDYKGVEALREKRLEEECLIRKKTETKRKTEKTEGQRLNRVIKSLSVGNWQLFLKQFTKIKAKNLSDKDTIKYKRIKAGIGKGLPIEEIAKLSKEIPGKWRGSRVKRSKVPEYKALSKEEYEEAVLKERGSLKRQLKGIKRIDIYYSIILFFPILLFIFLLILKRAFKDKDKPLKGIEIKAGSIHSGYKGV